MPYERVDPVTVPGDYEKVLVTDLEGTLTPPGGVWPALCASLPGTTVEDNREMYDAFRAGDLTQVEWRATLVDAWTGHDPAPTRDRIEGVMQDHRSYRPEAADFVGHARDHAYFTLLASGAPDAYSRRAVDELGLHQDVPSVWAVYDEDDVLTRFDYSQYKFGKELLVAELQEQVDTVVAVGNGDNDIGMVEAAEHGFMVPSADLDYDAIDAVTGSLDDIRGALP